MKRENKNRHIVTIEEYLLSGRMNRIVFKSPSQRYLIDLPVRSFLSRIFLLAVIPLIKVYSLLLNDFQVAITKFTTDNLI